MKPVNPEKERIIQIVNQLLDRSALSIDQVVARMQVDGCEITRSTFENRFTTRVHQKPNVPAAWLLALIRAFTHHLLNDERCRAEEAVELAKLTRLPIDLLSEINSFFSKAEFNAALEKYMPLLYLRTAQSTTLGNNLLTEKKDSAKSNDALLLYNAPITTENSQSVEDWGEAPDISNFYGRSHELTQITAWVGQDGCRAVGIFGMSGIGKTMVTTKLARDLAPHFSAICWRSLHNAPPLSDFIGDCLLALTLLTEADLPSTLERRLTLLIQTLRQEKCLLVIDNYETVMEGGNSTGQYRDGYEHYAQFLYRVTETMHKSCIIITSQEKPIEFASMEGEGLPIRALTLNGLATSDIQQVLLNKRLIGTEPVWAQFCMHYSGNPLALKLAADTIRELFAGDIEAFLATDATLFHDIRELLDQQFSRLTLLERDLLYWLGIERKMVTLEALQHNLVQQIPAVQLLEALRSLRRRALIESHAHGFSLSTVVLGYITERLVSLMTAEIDAEMPLLLSSFSLLKTQTEEYLRDTQVRLLITPVLERLHRFWSTEEIAAKLWQMLEKLQATNPPVADYCAGNLLNLLVYLPANLAKRDLAGLTICQAHLHNVILQDTNFSGCTFRDTAFRESFGSISTVAYSPQGDRLAAGMTSGEIHIWLLDSDAPPLKLQGHTDMVWSIAFHPDGRRLASSSEDQSVRLWDVSSGECLLNIHAHNGWVKAVCFTQDGAQIVSVGHDALVRIWETSSGQSQMSWQGHEGWIWAVVSSPQAHRLATAGQDHLIKLWDAATGQCIATLAGHTAPVRALAFAPNGRLLASGSFDHTIKLWDVATGQCLRTLQGHTNMIWSVAFSPDGARLASSADDQSIRLWETATGEERTRLQGAHNRVWSVAFHPNGQMLTSGGDDQTLRFWAIDSGHLVRKQAGYTNQVWSLAISANQRAHGRQMASGGDDGIVRLWSLTEGRTTLLLQGHAERVRSVAFSLDGNWVASGSDDHTVRLWNAERGSCRRVLTGHTNRVWAIDFAADGRTLASASEDQTVRLWDLDSGRTRRTIRYAHGRIWSIAFHPTGHLLAGGTDTTEICLWDAENGEQLQTWQGHLNRVWHVAFSPDGKWLASGSADCTVRLWEVKSGRCRYVLEGHTDAVWAVAFSPDSQWLASSGDDQRICLWHVEHGALVHTLHGHQGCIWTLAFAEGNLLASGGQDETIRLWDVNNGRCQQTMRSERPYERMDITGTQGLTEAQKSALRTLGAIERE